MLSTNTQASCSEFESDPEAVETFFVASELLDPFHPRISPKVKQHILRERYHNKLIADCIETGRLRPNGFAGYRLVTREPLATFIGYVFEAFVVNNLNIYKFAVGRRAFEWCTNREKTKDSYISQYKAVGKGFVTTKQLYPNLYEPQSNLDVIFVRRNEKENCIETATVLGTQNTAGIQVKSIRGNERTEIINPLLEKKYTHVLTLLRHSDGVHSYTVCMDIISDIYRRREITQSDKDMLDRAIAYPEMIGIDQRYVDEYVAYTWAWYSGPAQPNEIIYDAVGMETKIFKWKSGLLISAD